MKKFYLSLCLSIFFSLTAQADICYDITSDTATKAINILHSTKEVYSYCSICDNTIPQIILIQEITSDKHVYINGKAIDLAHIYYKENDKYKNLGIASECIKPGEYNIFAELTNLPIINITPEDKKQQAKQRAQEIYNNCNTLTSESKIITSTDMVERNIKVNNCLANAIKHEIVKGFNAEQQAKVLKNLENIRGGVFDLYNNIYSTNKYCYGSCGSMTNILPYADEYKILMEILERLLYLNIAKSGY